MSATEDEQSSFLQRLMFLLAGEESRRTSERVRPNMRRRVEERRKRLTLYLAYGTLTPENYREASGDVEQAIATIDRELADQAPRADTAALLADLRAWLRLARELAGGTLAAVLPGTALEDQAPAIERIAVARGREPAIGWRPWVEALRGVVTAR